MRTELPEGVRKTTRPKVAYTSRHPYNSRFFLCPLPSLPIPFLLYTHAQIPKPKQKRTKLIRKGTHCSPPSIQPTPTPFVAKTSFARCAIREKGSVLRSTSLSPFLSLSTTLPPSLSLLSLSLSLSLLSLIASLPPSKFLLVVSTLLVSVLAMVLEVEVELGSEDDEGGFGSEDECAGFV